MSGERITTDDLGRMLARYVRACEALGIAPPAGFHIGLQHGSKFNGIAFRLYVTGDPVRDEAGEISYPNGSGHSRPPAGCDFLGMTKREAFEALADRCAVLEDVHAAQTRPQR